MSVCAKSPHLAQCPRFPFFEYDSLSGVQSMSDFEPTEFYTDLGGVSQLPMYEDRVLGGRLRAYTPLEGLGATNGGFLNIKFDMVAALVFAVIMAARCSKKARGGITGSIKAVAEDVELMKQNKFTTLGVITVVALGIWGIPFLRRLWEQISSKVGKGA
ncbi:MAG: hypothetical protein AMS21_00705 [Gemmatimonas sp. SG8_38_2]|nr:MAG: hypothetical protein AMS21_00705 [Gemmatimonas sp. SG8_38_2]